MSHVLVVATNNRGKLDELRALLAGMNVEVVSLKEALGRELTVVEDGKTVEANAVKKALEGFRATTMLTLADDSGLEVDVLDGAPGVYSARFAGERATDAENNAKLLLALDGLNKRTESGPPSMSYRARFRCVLALVDPYWNEGRPYVVEGVCEGHVTRTPRGAGGFGYDPLFVVDGTDKTMAELDDAEKNRISHRAQAFGKLKLVLEKVLAERDALTRSVCETTV